MSVDGRRIELDQRRGWARVRGVASALAGFAIIGVSGAALTLVALGSVARLWTWIRRRDIDQTDIWGVADESAMVIGIVAVVVAIGITFWWFWSGAIEIVLREVKATPVEAEDGSGHQGDQPDAPAASGKATGKRKRKRSGRDLRMVRNLAEELSIGLGQTPPEIFVTDDPTPNALSLRASRRRVLCVTSAVNELPRDEAEALIAHELGHLSAADAHWVTSGMVGLARARRACDYLMYTGSVVVCMTVGLAWNAGKILWGSFTIGLLLTLLGWGSRIALRRLEFGMRRHADEIADVVAVKLARNPESLAALCARLATDERIVRASSWRSELLWFERVEAMEVLIDEVDPAAVVRTRRELITRAQAAYAEARVPVPEPHRTEFANWLAAHPKDSTPLTTTTASTTTPAPAEPSSAKRRRERR